MKTVALYTDFCLIIQQESKLPKRPDPVVPKCLEQSPNIVSHHRFVFEVLTASSGTSWEQVTGAWNENKAKPFQYHSARLSMYYDFHFLPLHTIPTVNIETAPIASFQLILQLSAHFQVNGTLRNITSLLYALVHKPSFRLLFDMTFIS